MVQVDVFWGYAWGASLAAIAGDRLVAAEKPLETKYFTAALIFLSLFWAPTGLLLLLRHPSWETMQVAQDLSSLSEWLILGFGVTNITQGILGFLAGRFLLMRGAVFAAHLNWIAGYLGMFFILLYGWDGLGYDRFLYDRDLLAGSPAWTPGVGTAIGVLPALLRFLGSTVANTLYIDGLWLLPPFFMFAIPWRNEHRPTSSGAVIRSYFAGVFVVGFATAAFTALCVRGIAYALGIDDHVARALGEAPPRTLQHIVSYVIGIPLGLGLAWRLALAPGRVARRLFAPLS
jgi:hypothetical protein